jgi:hypothetical protein
LCSANTSLIVVSNSASRRLRSDSTSAPNRRRRRPARRRARGCHLRDARRPSRERAAGAGHVATRNCCARLEHSRGDPARLRTPLTPGSQWRRSGRSRPVWEKSTGRQHRVVPFDPFKSLCLSRRHRVQNDTTEGVKRRDSDPLGRRPHLGDKPRPVAFVATRAVLRAKAKRPPCSGGRLTTRKLSVGPASAPMPRRVSR